MLNLRVSAVLTVALLSACGGSVSLPPAAVLDADASQDALAVDALAPPADGAAEACVALEGTACASGANTCGPCPVEGVEYVCDGTTATLHRHDCAPRSSTFPCSCGLPADAGCWRCVAAGWVDTCTQVVAPDSESCLHCGLWCVSDAGGE